MLNHLFLEVFYQIFLAPQPARDPNFDSKMNREDRRQKEEDPERFALFNAIRNPNENTKYFNKCSMTLYVSNKDYKKYLLIESKNSRFTVALPCLGDCTINDGVSKFLDQSVESYGESQKIIGKMFVFC